MSSQLPSVTSPPWTATTKRIVAVIALVLLFVFARQVASSVWSSIVVAMVLAYLLSPVVTFFERRLSFIRWQEMRRTLSVLLTWLGVIGLLVLVLILIAPATASQLREFADVVPDLFASTEHDLRSALSREITIGDFTFVPWDEVEKAFLPSEDQADPEANTLTSTIQSTARSLADPALDVLGGAVQFLFTLFFVLILLFYLMRDGPFFVEYIVRSVPESYQGDARRLFYELSLIWNAYLRGQLLLCLSVGLATYIAALILGLPQPLVLASVAGFLEFIPNLGPTIAQIPALLFALTTPSSTFASLDAGLGYALVVSLTYILIQNLEAIFLVPRIMGHSLDLHPFVVLVAVLVGASLWGVLGVVLAAPMAATLRLLGRYVRGKLLDEDAFPTETDYVQRTNRLYLRLIRFLLSKRFPPLPELPALPAQIVSPQPDVEAPDSGNGSPEREPAPSTDVSHWAL